MKFSHCKIIVLTVETQGSSVFGAVVPFVFLMSVIHADKHLNEKD